MAGLRLAMTMLLAVVGVAAACVVPARAYGYDGIPPTDRVVVLAARASEAGPTRPGDVREESASPSVDARGTVTTPVARSVATEVAAGPAAWKTASESMSGRAAEFQAKVTGAAPGTVYRVGGVDFDGFAKGTLLEAKGPGYASFVRGGQFRSWFQGAEDLVSQAARQLVAAGGTPIQWVVAEPAAAAAIRYLFAQNGISGINVSG